MPDYRPPIQDYIRACEALLKLDELSDEEAEVVEEDMVGLPISFSTTSSRERCALSCNAVGKSEIKLSGIDQRFGI